MHPLSRRLFLGLAPAAFAAACTPVAAPPEARPLSVRVMSRTTTNQDANLRRGPTTRSNLVARVPRGTPVDVLGHSGPWTRVMVRGSYGYIHASLLGPRRRATAGTAGTGSTRGTTDGTTANTGTGITTGGTVDANTCPAGSGCTKTTAGEILPES